MSTHTVGAPKPNALHEIFGRSSHIVIGVIHSLPLPGSPSYQGEPLETIYDFAIQEARSYQTGGVHGLILENHGDIPFSKPEHIGHETVATMAVMADRVRQSVNLPLGINVLANAALPALAIAQAGGARFVRVNQWANAYVANEGFVEGPAGQATRYRAWLRAQHLRIFADVHVKHGSHAIVADRSITELTRDAEFFDADVVIATGQRTGDAAELEEIRAIRTATSLPLLVGSGATADNVGEILSLADGVIVASSLKEEGVWWTPVSVEKVRHFMAAITAA